jgi:hypothetical protein
MAYGRGTTPEQNTGLPKVGASIRPLVKFEGRLRESCWLSGEPRVSQCEP